MTYKCKQVDIGDKCIECFRSTSFGDISTNQWPKVDLSLIEDNEIDLPIQIMGKFVTTISTAKDYNEEEILKSIFLLDKIKSKIDGKEVKKVINVQNKIINIIVT